MTAVLVKILLYREKRIEDWLLERDFVVAVTILIIMIIIGDHRI